MQFSRLRLTGFKSFVDTTDIFVEPGLTGIVGPNGCGKSNLVEALRWVMGASSARQVRGREMDDVIFSGSATPPSRNHAEVSVLLDNAARTAPAAYNDASEIEVSRRIERDAGSVYRINGREVRARDVQLLFADEATGARNSAMVSQGEIGELVAAKPAERRTLLEEAAGITGLHSRRHEAELRLRAADSNLERLDDVIGALEAQLQGLKRQARQATRYRRLGERIRQAEARLYGRRRQAALEAVAAAEQALAEAERVVAARTREAAAAAADQAQAAAVLTPLREAEAGAGAALHRLEVAQVELDAEERRLDAERHELESRLAQIDADVERESGLARDADEAITGLDGEHAAVSAAQEVEQEAESRCAAARAQAAEAVADLEREVDALSAHLAAEEARRAALGREIEGLAARAERLRARAAEIDSELAGLRDGAEHALDGADAAVAAANEEAEARRAEVVEAERRRVAAQAAEATARDALQAAETAHAALCAEQAALSDLLGEAGDAWPALIDEVNVEAGMVTALGAALGDYLAASNDPDEPMHWRQLDPDPAAPRLPKGAKPLSHSVTGPPALERRLSQVGVVAPADGPRLQAALAQGQRLVSRVGALWRWDGLTVAADAATPAATRLKQKNRLKALGGEIADSETRRAAAMKELAVARAALARADEEERATRAALGRADEALGAARDARAEATAAAASASLRLSNLTESAERLAAELDEAEDRRTAALAAREAPDVEGRVRLDSHRASLTERRRELAECDSVYARVRREAEARRDRLAAIAAELESWRRRAAGAAERLTQLAERRAAATAELDALGGRPVEIAAQREALLETVQAAQGDRKRAADAVAEAETRLAGFDRRLKDLDGALAEAREHRVRCESAHEQAARHRDEVDRAIAERLECAPAELAGVAGLEEGAAWPEEEEIETRLARLIRERDSMGPVNLRAEVEAAEVEEQFNLLAGERVDLEAAIARLRQGIARLNRKGRERLESAFDKINGHFGALFTRLFAGGRAHLSLVDSDDPLEAGLEVMASPPGKRLQSLSLLSGGEQALTALALLFAVFLTNPTPICVLDEVDAPLDDANVARFCDLLEDIAQGSSTRFLIVTHHRMTMARMDRLFGVTMAERGVSQLVSVDLGTAEELRAAD